MIPTMTETAPTISRLPTCWSVNRTPSGSAITRLNVVNDCTTISGPRSSAAAWRTHPMTCMSPPNEPDRFMQNLDEESCILARRRGLQRPALLQHCARCERARGKQGKNGSHTPVDSARLPVALSADERREVL